MSTFRDLVVQVPVRSGSACATASGARAAPTINKDRMDSDMKTIKHCTFNGGWRVWEKEGRVGVMTMADSKGHFVVLVSFIDM